MAEASRKLGPYTLIRKIGRGAFGVVWLAEKQTAIATTRFALKLPRDEDIDLEAFKQEAAMWLYASGHPNVLPMIDADIYDGQVVIVSEYVADGSLAAWLIQHGGKAPTIEAACEILEGVLCGLAHLHERRIIHRDLKPENILLQSDTPRVTDFGIARLLKTSSYSNNISGTLAYMAPEAFSGKRNERTDIWAVGVIFYQLLAGRLPYDQPDMVSLIGAITRDDPAPLSKQVPEVFCRVMMKALKREPSERYSAATEMLRDLRDAEHMFWLEKREANAPTEMGSTEETKPKGPEEKGTGFAGGRHEPEEERTRKLTEDLETDEVGSAETTAAAPPTRPGPAPAETITAVFPQQVITRKARDETVVPARRRKSWIVAASLVAIAALSFAAWWFMAPSKAEREETARQEAALKPLLLAQYRDPLTTQKLIDTGQLVKNSIGMELRRIAAGSFMMGSEVVASFVYTTPVHRVTISKDFYMETTEVTQGQWEAVMGTTVGQQRDKTDHSLRLRGEGSDYPMYYVSWNDTQEFIKKLNQMKDGYSYRLPTEAEWEYSCRAGTVGDDVGDLDSIAWYANNSGQRYLDAKELWYNPSRYGDELDKNGNQTHPVGTKQANAFGLYDMLGNVHEWCNDRYSDNYYEHSPSTDPQGEDSGEARALRGQYWGIYSDDVRPAWRSDNGPAERNDSIGFRVVAVARTH
jgi:formylglycine-generating enzyme required for sulfatase activity